MKRQRLYATLATYAFLLVRMGAARMLALHVTHDIGRRLCR